MLKNLKQEQTDRPAALKRVGIYLRKSNKTEGRSKSLDEQRDHCLAVAEHFSYRKENLTIFEEEEGQKGNYYYQDALGRHPKPWRPELTKLVHAIEAGEIEVVMVWRSDRLYRDLGVCDALMKVFKQHGTLFIAGTRDMDIDSAGGMYQAGIEAANNERWRNQISEDIRRDHHFKAERGDFTRDPTCFGFRSKGKGTQAVEFVEAEIATTNRIFRLFCLGEEGAGPLGITGIANLLMREGYQWPKGRRGHKVKNPEQIHTNDIRNLLTNVMFIGQWRHDGKIYDCPKLLVPDADVSGRKETLVPLELWHRAQDKLAASETKGKRSLGYEHLLTGLVVCGGCGWPMQVNFRYYQKTNNEGGQEPRKSFRCGLKTALRARNPHTVLSVQEPVLEEWILTYIRPILVAQLEAMRQAPTLQANRQALADLERRLLDLKRKETDDLVRLVGSLDPEQMQNVASQLRAVREALEHKAAVLRTQIQQTEYALPSGLAEDLKLLPKATLKDALRQTIEWIAVTSEGVVVLTKWGVYLAGAYCEAEANTYKTRDVHRTIAPPSPVATLECLGWFTNPRLFVGGRRYMKGHRSERLTDDEILPGAFVASEEAYVMKLPDDHSKEA